MAEIIIYSKNYCPYCVKAKMLLKHKGREFREINIEGNAELVEEMLAKSGGRRTVPQIFVGDQHIGGFDDLKALDDSGKLDVLLTD